MVRPLATGISPSLDDDRCPTLLRPPFNAASHQWWGVLRGRVGRGAIDSTSSAAHSLIRPSFLSNEHFSMTTRTFLVTALLAVFAILASASGAMADPDPWV